MQIRFSHAVVAATFCGLAALGACAPPPPSNSPAAAMDSKVATVLGKTVLLRSVTPEGHLEKKQELSATEYVKWLRTYRTSLMLYRICGPVQIHYAKREKLEPSDAEIKKLIQEITKTHGAHLNLDDEEAARKHGMRMFGLYGASHGWRTAKGIHKKYGGRVGISSFGACTAIDGLHAILMEYVAAGDLTFHDNDLENAFWERVKRNPFTDVVLRPERVEQHFSIAPWERYRGQLITEALKLSENAQ